MGKVEVLLLLLLACTTTVLAQVNFYYYNPVFWNSPQISIVQFKIWDSNYTNNKDVTLIRCASNEGYYVSPSTISPPGGDTNGYFLAVGEDNNYNDVAYDNAEGNNYRGGLDWTQANVLLYSPTGTNGTFVNTYSPSFNKSSGCNPTTQFYYNNAQWTANGYTNIQLWVWDNTYAWQQTYTLQSCAGGWWTANVSGDARGWFLPFDQSAGQYDHSDCSQSNYDGISYLSPYVSLITNSSGCGGYLNNFFTGVDPNTNQIVCNANSPVTLPPSTQFYYYNPTWLANSGITQVQLWTWDTIYGAEQKYNLVTQTQHGVTYYYSPAIYAFYDSLTTGHFLPVGIITPYSPSTNLYDHSDCSGSNYNGLFNYTNPANGLYSPTGCNGIFSANFVPPTPTPTATATPTSTATPTVTPFTPTPTPKPTSTSTPTPKPSTGTTPSPSSTTAPPSPTPTGTSPTVQLSAFALIGAFVVAVFGQSMTV